MFINNFLRTKKPIILMVFCTIFTSLGQIFWKLGINYVHFEKLLTFLNIYVVFGFITYGIGALLMILAFREGELSVLYPIIATSYVWVSIISPGLFPTDVMNSWKWLGIFLILISVSILGIGSNKTNIGEKK